MTSKKQESMHQQVDTPADLERMKEAITTKVLKKLGKPTNLFKIDANHLWANKWRVNVWIKGVGTGEGVVPSFEIADSFFVEVSKDNNRMTSSPRIVKKY